VNVTRRNLLLGATVVVPTTAILLGRATPTPQPNMPTRLSATSRSVARVISAEPTTDGAGVRLNRALGGRALSVLDPFLLLDEFQSDDPNDYIAGFPDHPHRGFETVTYMIHGAMEHKDSVGNHGHLGPGSAQWMTAGHGIVHSEMPKQESGLMWGFQLWVNLPAKRKMIRPRYQDIPPASIGEVALERGKARIVAGNAFGVTGPVQGIDVDPVFVDLALEKGARVEQTLPAGHAAFVYVTDGAVRIGPDAREVRKGQLAVLTNEGDGVAAMCDADSGRFMLLAGRPIGEPVARRGPFVMNTREELDRAFEEYRAGTLTSGV
jgi:quercetin 2,3-dioxygenase